MDATKMEEKFRLKAKEILGGCTCDFEKGFAWDGTHKENCGIERVAKILEDFVLSESLIVQKRVEELEAELLDLPDKMKLHMEESLKTILKLWK